VDKRSEVVEYIVAVEMPWQVAVVPCYSLLTETSLANYPSAAGSARDATEAALTSPLRFSEVFPVPQTFVFVIPKLAPTPVYGQVDLRMDALKLLVDLWLECSKTWSR
jgi:hypothetical protein